MAMTMERAGVRQGDDRANLDEAELVGGGDFRLDAFEEGEGVEIVALGGIHGGAEGGPVKPSGRDVVFSVMVEADLFVDAVGFELVDEPFGIGPGLGDEFAAVFVDGEIGSAGGFADRLEAEIELLVLVAVEVGDAGVAVVGGIEEAGAGVDQREAEDEGRDGDGDEVEMGSQCFGAIFGEDEQECEKSEEHGGGEERDEDAAG